MKKLFCFLLCLTLIFSSVSLCFATPVSWDSSDHQNLTEIRNAFFSGGTIYNILNAINSNIVDLDSNLVTLMGWLDPANGGSSVTILNKILSVLSYTDTGGALKSWLADIWQVNSVNLPRINDIYTMYQQPGIYNPTNFLWSYPTNTGKTETRINRNTFTTFQNLAWLIQSVMNDQNSIYAYEYQHRDLGYNNSQSALSWTDINSNISFTPTSVTDGLYNWLKNIQYPVARLSYVLASDERIAAQEAAAANEVAVVDNFIESSGDGSTSPSDIGSVSDLSSGYKQNFGSDASVSGIFNIFDSNNMGWFSQETKNQLDTTAPSRIHKGSMSETPLLDKQIEDIYDALGVKQP